MAIWNGPGEFLFKSYKDHTDTFQYIAEVSDKVFSFYIPKYMFIDNTYSENLLISFQKKEGPNAPIGFTNEQNDYETIWSGPKNTEVFRYVTGNKVVNSKLYKVFRNGRDYKLYMPNAIFGSLEAPTYVLVIINAQT